MSGQGTWKSQRGCYISKHSLKTKTFRIDLVQTYSVRRVLFFGVLQPEYIVGTSLHIGMSPNVLTNEIVYTVDAQPQSFMHFEVILNPPVKGQYVVFSNRNRLTICVLEIYE